MHRDQRTCGGQQSPPSRAAWIEIPYLGLAVVVWFVAAFTGGVYKNFEPPFDNWTFDLF